MLENFSLHRSIDLARLHRTLSFVGGRPFILVQRKGWKCPRWEEVMVLPHPSLSPFHLLRKYVELTEARMSGWCQGRPKEAGIRDKHYVLRTMNAPFNPLSADAVGGITARLLKKYGIPTDMWGPHSTRGAAAVFFLTKTWG